ncbi:MAG: cation:proton antiporter [Acidobacteriota bacterium]
MPGLMTILALVAFVLVLAGLTEGFVSRAPISFPMIFLGIGFVLAARGTIAIPPHSPTLEAVAIVSLSLVLFLDAVRMRFDKSSREWLVPSLILGPGTLVCLGLIGLAAHFLLGMGLVASILLGAILSSTDPVVLRDMLRDKRIPTAVRQALRVEAGTNDLVALPIVLGAIAVVKSTASTPGEWAWLLGRLLVVGPAAGFFIGASGAWLMTRADRRWGIRREYQALFGLGLVFASYVAGVAVGGDGFLAAFAAGAAIAALDLDLCDCFLEYGDATAEMIMLFAFILFGAALWGLFAAVPAVPAIALALFTIFVARPAAIALVLRRAAVSPSARVFIGWFGPRGLASLLLALLAVRANVAGAEMILAIAGVVVTVSVLLHGVTAMPLTTWYVRRIEAGTLAEERVSTASDLLRVRRAEPADSTRIGPRELALRLAGPRPPLVLDVRSRSGYEKDPVGIPGSVRVLPDQVADWAADRKKDQSIVAYCT